MQNQSHSRSFLLFLKFLSLFQCLHATEFNLTSLPLNSLKLLGDAHWSNATISLSRDLPVPNSGAGRVLFAHPIPLLHPTTFSPFPFSTFFSFSVTNLNPSSTGGGLAFLLSPDDHSLGDSGGFLGLLSASAGEPAAAFLAVEFDTLMDVEFGDINGNHVGVDLGSLVSVEVVDLGSASVELKSGDLVNVWIEFDELAVLQVFVSHSTVRHGEPVISFPVDLSQFADEQFVYVGFSASTQGSTEIHSIEWWSFSSSSPSSPPNSSSSTTSPPALAPAVPISAAGMPESLQNETLGSSSSHSSCQNDHLCKQGPAAVAGVVMAAAFVAASCAGFAVWVGVRRAKPLEKYDTLVAATDITSVPREFSYRELSAATNGFVSSRIIGQGAFGTVYKGIIPKTGATIAVKRCIHNAGDDGKQGRQEFLSELSIITNLRHRNLVRLQGWCHEKGEILLVYDYMIHGSLDKALFDPKITPLSWRHRKTILSGVASALEYLHGECERQVIHRDIKSGNVMLDEGFHPRLGDFGLARQFEHEKSPATTIAAGTMGYLAPEYLLTGRASEKTDVFSFGALVLEVVAGRRVIAGDEGRSLVEWVWRLHRKGAIFEAVDERMGGEYEEEDLRRVLMVGLACSSLDPVARPGMRKVVEMLGGEVEPPVVPVAQPALSFGFNQQLLLSLQESLSDCNGLALNLSSSCSPPSSSSSSTSSLKSNLRDGPGGGGAAAE